MPPLQRFKDIARTRQSRVVMPEMDDPRVAQAAERLEREGLAVPVPLSEPSDAQRDAITARRGIKPALAEKMLSKPLIRAAAMVATGEADAMVAGAHNPTKKVIEAAGLAIGLEDGISNASSFFLMVFPDGRQLVFADCAVMVDPSAEALASIAAASARSAKAVLGEARVALLSYSTGQSGVGPSVDKVREAASASGFLGPIQADAALNPIIAEKKGMGNGDANVLIFPSLDAANVAYKLCQEFAGAQAIGPILQGFRKPVCDLSRGASVDDIVAATVVTVSML